MPTKTQVNAGSADPTENSWEDLHRDVLQRIVTILPIEDFLAFSSVCSSWRSVADRELYNKEMTIPWLMLTSKEATERREFYNLSSGKIHNVFLPKAKWKNCLSSRGWIMTVGIFREVHILNPFHGRNSGEIKLPGISGYIEKFVLSASPSLSKDYTVMVLRNGRISFWKPGDCHWNHWNYWATVALPGAVWNWDLIFYDGRFLAVNINGDIVECDIDGPNPPRVSVVLEMPNGMLRDGLLDNRLYLVESEGSLLLVIREEKQPPDEDDHYEYATTEGFQVFEANIKEKEWKQVNDLGNGSLFIGMNSSFSVQVRDTSLGIKPNRIYFTEDFGNGHLFTGYDSGVYHMKDRVIEKHFMITSHCGSSPRLWLEAEF